jgi:phosphodiesterase/alkaline phosphatase D-like protein
LGQFRGNIVLGSPSAASIKANVFSADQAGTVWLIYGTSAGVYLRQSATGTLVAGQPLELGLTALSADTQYYYRLQFVAVNGVGSGATEEFSFHTARASGTSFTFAIQGDSHPERTKTEFDAELYTRTLLTAAADKPDFYLAMGDDFSVDTLPTLNAAAVIERYAVQRPFLGLVGRNAPVYLVNGNHEQAARYLLDGTPNNVAVWAQNARNTHYSQPAPDSFYSGNTEQVPYIGLLRNFYAWNWGDALFVVIDPYWASSVAVDNVLGDGTKRSNMWDVTHGDAQYQWLKTTLEQSQAKYKFVFAHHVMGTGRGGVELAGLWEWGGQNAKGVNEMATYRPSWTSPIHQLMVANKVSIFFQGHDHIWAHQQLDGVTYQTLPEPADPNYALHNSDAFLSGDKFPNTGYTRVNVSPSSIKVDYVRTYLPADEGVGKVSGSVVFSYSVPATASAPVATPQVFSGNIVLGAPTSSSIKAKVLSPDLNGTAWLAYGMRAGGYDQKSATQAVRAGQPVEWTLNGLNANTAYFYQLQFQSAGSSTVGKSEEYSFHTVRPVGSNFVFTLQADSHLDENSDLDLYQRTLANVLADKPDFHIDLGDTFMTEKHAAPLVAAVAMAPDAATVNARYAYERGNFGRLTHSVPLFLANGNHDAELGWLLDGSAQNNAIWAAQARLSYFPTPTPGSFYSGDSTQEPWLGQRASWYAWQWGDALFIVLDPYWKSGNQASKDAWNITLGEAQYQWLTATLAASTASYKLVMVHNLVGGLDGQMRGGIEAAPFFEWGGKNLDGSDGFAQKRPGWALPIHQLLVQHHVTAVFHGHDHLYAKQDLDGIVYQEVPQPSAANSFSGASLANEYHYASGTLLDSSGHLRVSVTPTAVTTEYVRAWLPKNETTLHQNAQVVDRWSVPAQFR